MTWIEIPLNRFYTSYIRPIMEYGNYSSGITVGKTGYSDLHWYPGPVRCSENHYTGHAQRHLIMPLRSTLSLGWVESVTFCIDLLQNSRLIRLLHKYWTFETPIFHTCRWNELTDTMPHETGYGRLLKSKLKISNTSNSFLSKIHSDPSTTKSFMEHTWPSLFIGLTNLYFSCSIHS